MRIYLDNLIYALQRAGGISVYWKELTKRLLATDHQILFLEHKKVSENIFRQELPLKLSQVVKDLPLPTRALRHLDPILKTEDFSIFHSSYYRIIKRKHLFNIVTVHDFIHENQRKGLPRIAHSYQKSRAIRQASGVICISESTKKDLLKFYPYLQEERIAVIYHGYGEEFRKLSSSHPQPELFAQVNKKVVVYVGDRAAYKNFVQAVEALHELNEFHLLIIGGNELANKEKELLSKQIPGRFTHLLGLDSSQLNVIYNFAYCLLYPSSYEGFGLPILEAMAAGCPVIAVNTSSIPEVSGGAALLVEEANPDLLKNAILKLQEISLRSEMIDKGLKQIRRFSWDRCFEETLSFYQKILSLNHSK